jgi:SprT protein
VDVHYDLRGKAAGQVVWRHGAAPLIRYNLDIAERQQESFIRETVPHEVAHVVVRLLHPYARPHGREWQAVMQHLGVTNPQRCHRFEVAAQAGRSQRRWGYRCACKTHQLSTTRHKRMQAGKASYLCRCCGGPLSFSGR